jgi:multiple sugar transport system permease protein
MNKTSLYIFLIIFGIVFAYPFLWMLSATLKPEVEIGSLSLLSSNFSFDNYRVVFTKINVGRAFFNSIFVSLCVTGSVIVFGSIVGYALARLNFFGKSLIFNTMIFTMVIPFQITMIPMYILMVKFGWIDSYLALIVPAMTSTFGILLFRQFFLDIPQDLIDAARIDGCNEWTILFRIIWPLSTPVIITVAILTFMANWNEVLWPMIVVRVQDIMTMPQVVALFKTGGAADSQLGVELAAAALLAIPIILIYSFFQKYFIESMASSGLKN